MASIVRGWIMFPDGAKVIIPPGVFVMNDELLVIGHPNAAEKLHMSLIRQIIRQRYESR